MKKILFRGQAINRDKGEHTTNYKNGEWVYGLITRLYDERFPNLPAEMSNEYGVTEIEIDYKTIGQYTGLVDKNGKKIFEGDIVLLRDDEEPYQVAFDECCFQVYDSGVCYNMDCFRSKDIEIIGNIHDNKLEDF